MSPGGRRVASGFVTILGVVTLVFLFVHGIPGDPVDILLGETAAPADREELRRALGLDRSLTEQYAAYLGGLSRGDLGRSLRDGRPVVTRLAERAPATMVLALAASLLATAIAIPLGILAAARRGSWIDSLATGLALTGASLPNFVLGPLLVLLFSIELGWLPVSGAASPSSLVLPALTLGLGMSAILTRLTRSALLDTLSSDYVRSARAKGLGELRVLGHHALRNALLPVVTVFGLQVGGLLGGAIITEMIFAWPGIGGLTLEAIHGRDYPLLQGCVLAIALSYVAVNWLTDLAYARLDPRIRLGARGPQ